MGLALTKLVRLFWSTEEHRIIIIGLDNAGKTTGEGASAVIATSPTIGSNVEEFVYRNIKCLMWDIGGQESLRKSWRY
ncbi:ADP-ribosylation factor family-domain-containing protein, partial [Blyttiomyces helicus]